MRQLFCAVVIPKMTYALDVWYTPVHKKEGAGRRSGSVGIANRYRSLQRLAATAITGALCTTMTDFLDLHADLWPAELLLQCICHRAATWMASLPIAHPLHDVFRKQSKRYIKSHRLPLHELGLLLGIDPGQLETLDPVHHPPTHELKQISVQMDHQMMQWQRI